METQVVVVAKAQQGILRDSDTTRPVASTRDASSRDGIHSKAPRSAQTLDGK